MRIKVALLLLGAVFLIFAIIFAYSYFTFIPHAYTTTLSQVTTVSTSQGGYCNIANNLNCAP